VKNPSGKKLEKLVFGMFDQMIEGADKYVTEQGSTWLIFTKEKKWVVEFTKDKTLWFNYNLFQSELELIGKDCTEEKDLIKNWFESRFLGIKPVEDTIQNGVKETTPSGYLGSIEMEGKIVHQIESPKQNNEVEDTLQNGVRQTSKRLQKPFRSIKDAIQNGVKETKGFRVPMIDLVEDIIENGICDVKHSCDFEKIVVKDIIEDSYPHKHRVEGVIRNTVKDGI